MVHRKKIHTLVYWFIVKLNYVNTSDIMPIFCHLFHFSRLVSSSTPCINPMSTSDSCFVMIHGSEQQIRNKPKFTCNWLLISARKNTFCHQYTWLIVVRLISLYDGTTAWCNSRINVVLAIPVVKDREWTIPTPNAWQQVWMLKNPRPFFTGIRWSLSSGIFYRGTYLIKQQDCMFL